MSASLHQQPPPAFVASQPVLASAGLVLVPAETLSAQPASAPVVWQVSSANSRPALPIATDNPAFFRVAAPSSLATGAGSLPIIDTCLPLSAGTQQPMSFAPGRGVQPVANVLPASATEYIIQNINTGHMMTTQQPVDTGDQTTTLQNAGSIPDIVLTGRVCMSDFIIHFIHFSMFTSIFLEVEVDRLVEVLSDYFYAEI